MCNRPGRIISLSWHPSGTLIAAGMMDMIRIFDAETGEEIQLNSELISIDLTIAKTISWTSEDTLPISLKYPAVMGFSPFCLFLLTSGHATNRLLVERGVGASKNKEVVVWSVAFLSDNTIISGDSAGKVQFWDGVTGTLLRTHLVTKWDVLCLSVSQVSFVLPRNTTCFITFLIRND